MGEILTTFCSQGELGRGLGKSVKYHGGGSERERILKEKWGIFMKGFSDKKESKMNAFPYFSVNLGSPSYRMGPQFSVVISIGCQIS